MNRHILDALRTKVFKLSMKRYNCLKDLLKWTVCCIDRFLQQMNDLPINLLLAMKYNFVRQEIES